ncbi:MAG: TIGR03862 family flavoprotein [Microthrixaceae bacterium]
MDPLPTDFFNSSCNPIGPTAAVIGGGPGGLMAAEVLARSGASVTVYEQMPTMGRKFLIAGRGGLNITHSEPLELLLSRYGDKATELTAAVSNFPPSAIQDWCASLSQKTFVGSSGRVFPSGFRATELLRTWLALLKTLGVRMENGERWMGWDEETGALLISAVDPVIPEIEPRSLFPEVTLMSLGGGSWARTGSDAKWVPRLRNIGLRVQDLRPANSGFVVQWSPAFLERFEGKPVKNIAIKIGDTSERGEIMISAEGIEGGAVYAVGRELRDSLDRGNEMPLRIDLRPDLSLEVLESKLRSSRPKASLSTLLQRSVGLPDVSIGLMREATQNDLPRDPLLLAQLIKALPIAVVEIQGLDRAISTAGGLGFEELTDEFMLRQRPGVFVAGEMIDWEAPTGGYLLQATLSTAVAAARGALHWWIEQQARAEEPDL